jgi:transportin-1
MARIIDPSERHDAFKGFVRAVYANPNAIQTAASRPSDAISSILFAIVSWHMPENFDAGGISMVQFQPFPQAETALGEELKKLLQDIKVSSGEETWRAVESQMPVNVMQLLREMYQV